MELNYADFVFAMNEGREIEILFHGKRYFFASYKKRKISTYIFSEISDLQQNNFVVYNNMQELLNIKIQNFTLRHILANLDDYIIF